MTNRELHNYKKIALIDTHVHMVYQDSIDKTVQIYRNIMNYFEYGGTSDLLTKLEHGFVYTATKERDAVEIESLRKVYSYFMK